MKTLRPWVVARALLITAVIGVEWLDAMPLPTLRPAHLEQPLAKAEIARWTRLLNQLGAGVSQDDVTALGLEIGSVTTRFRRASMKPFLPVKSRTMTGQGWALFAYPDPYAGRLSVEIDVEGRWQPIWRAPDRDGSRISRLLRYRRVRGVYDDAGDTIRPRAIYGRFVDWIARETLREHPAVERVQVRIDLVEIQTPRQGPEPEETRRHVRVRTRTRLEQKAAMLRSSHPDPHP